VEKVSVIISAFSIERASTIRLCIESLKRQTLQPLEIILVLDPIDSVIEFYKNFVPPDVRIVISKGFGMSNARNSAIKCADGDIVAFIDDDAYASPEWLANLTKAYVDPLVVGVGGAAKPVWEGGYPQWLPEELYWIVGCSYKGLPENTGTVRNPIGCNMSFRRNLFEEVGYFTSAVSVGKNVWYHNLIGAEEAAFSLKVLRKYPHSKVLHQPHSIIYHRVPKKRATLTYLLTRSYREGYSKALITKASSKSQDSLSTERNYMNTLLKESIPKRLKKPYDPKNTLQVLVLFAGTVFVFFGYLSGTLSE
jgi:glycosyltransferase involved in cell wall biosynthesis